MARLRISGLIFLTVLYVSLAEVQLRLDAPVVTLSTGSIEGRFLQTDTGARGFVYQGVPFAEPPLGPLRFTKPVPKKPWQGVLPAKEYRAACPQNATISPQDLLDEDCLYLNIFAGVQCTTDNLCPVIYYIHGGANEFDSVRMFPPDILVENFADNGVVFVLTAYRLGILGFFSTGTEDAIGNWAMEDMVEGARWIQREIHHFGGDKKRVTAMGHSSSARAVSLLTMTPKTEGLLHQAVIMSGSATREGAIDNNLKDYKDITVDVGCATYLDWQHQSNHASIVECMRTIPAQHLVNRYNEIRLDDPAVSRTISQVSRDIAKEYMNFELPPRLTSPKNDGPDGLFPHPLNRMIVERRPIPTMTGTTKNEGAGTSAGFPNANGYTVALMCDFVVQSNKFHSPLKVSRACQKHYILLADPDADKNSSSPYPFWARQVATMLDDVNYFAPCYKEASTLRDKGATVFLYSFDYVKRGMEGVAPWHSFDLTYVVGIHQDRIEFDERDREIKKIYAPLFVNFAKYGHPTPLLKDDVDEWLPLESPDGYNYLSVDLPTRMKPDYHKDNVMFWNDEVPKIENEWNYVGNAKKNL